VSALDEIAAERDNMLARARGGVTRDDGRAPERWLRSLQSLLDGGYGQRQLWVKIGAVALRAVEAIDRQRSAWDGAR